MSTFTELESHHFQLLFLKCDLLTSAKCLPTEAINRRYLLDTVTCQMPGSRSVSVCHVRRWRAHKVSLGSV